MDFLIIVLGIAILLVGGELLVKGAVNVALRFHISTLVVGMTIVSFGTSAPELLVSVKAMLAGYPEISVGNVVGSNVANIALVLGITAIIFPIEVTANSYKIDWPMLMLSSFLVLGFMYWNYDPVMTGDFVTFLSWGNGVVMLAFLVGFSVYLIRKSRKVIKGNISSDEEYVHPPQSSIFKDVLFIGIGSLGLSYGASLLVDGTIGVAAALGISDYIISVTVVAFGTSLPELITSAMAAFKRHADLSIGNLIGSNIFNILGILGITSLFADLPITNQVFTIDMWWVIGLSAILFPLMITGKKIGKWEGLALVLLYVVYVYFVIF
jgi:cation:H+ antiporter